MRCQEKKVVSYFKYSLPIQGEPRVNIPFCKQFSFGIFPNGQIIENKIQEVLLNPTDLFA
jgi:hypothetical protein